MAPTSAGCLGKVEEWNEGLPRPVAGARRQDVQVGSHEEVNLTRGGGECGGIRGKLGTKSQIIGSPKNHATDHCEPVNETD